MIRLLPAALVLAVVSAGARADPAPGAIRFAKPSGAVDPLTISVGKEAAEAEPGATVQRRETASGTGTPRLTLSLHGTLELGVVRRWIRN